MRLQKMRKITGCYLLVLGTLEIVLSRLPGSVPFMIRPHAALLWLSFFEESEFRSSTVSMSMCILLVIAGMGLLTRRRWAAIPYCIVGALIAVVDLQFPLVIMIFGGGHVLGFTDGALMWLAAIVYDALPVSLAFGVVGHYGENPKSKG